MGTATVAEHDANGDEGISVGGLIVVVICVLFLLYKILKQALAIYREIVTRHEHEAVTTISVVTIEHNAYRESLECIETSV